MLPRVDAAATAEVVSGMLVIVTASEETSRRIESHLRNAGHPLRVTWLATLEDIEDMLRHAPPDLLLCDRELRGLTRDRVLSACRSLRPELPVLLLARDTGTEGATAALAAGAQDLVACEDAAQLRHLELVVMREIIQHQRLRRLRQLQAQLADCESRHRQLLNAMQEAVGLVQEGIVSAANPALLRLLGHDEDDRLTGLPLIDLVDPAHRASIKAQLRAIHQGRLPVEWLPLRLAGRHAPIDVELQLIPGMQDGERTIELLVRAAAEPAAQPTAAASAAAMMPGGRGAFLAALERVHGRPGAQAALLLQVDAHEALEQRLGIAEAEATVAEIGRLLQSALGSADSLAAYAPDQFALVLSRATHAEIEAEAERLRRLIAERLIATPSHETQASLSIAVHSLDSGLPLAGAVHTLVAEARRLSTAGGNRLAVLGAARADEDARLLARRAAQVEAALADNSLQLAYQSIASLEGDTQAHYDVLLRMLDEQGRELRAAEFLPAAARHGLMLRVDRWVVTTALGILARRTTRQDAATLFVKLSEDTLREADGFVSWLQAQCRLRPLQADELVFEIPERVLQGHLGKARLLVDALKALGAGLAIEHFGIGSHPLQMLDHLPAQYLKFDASFTQHFGERDTQSRLQALVEAGRERGMKTIVCHVEDANLMARLWQIGINFIQGYHVNEPEVVLLGGELTPRA